MDINTGTEYCMQTGHITTPQFEGQITLRAGGHGRIEKTEHGHHTAHHIIDSEILHAQCLQHHAAGIKGNRHEEQHPAIEQQRILGDTFVVRRSISHNRGFDALQVSLRSHPQLSHVGRFTSTCPSNFISLTCMWYSQWQSPRRQQGTVQPSNNAQLPSSCVATPAVMTTAVVTTTTVAMNTPAALQEATLLPSLFHLG